MSAEHSRRAVAMAKGRAVLEASGNVTLATVRAIAETGVDYISSGAITHSAPSLDVALDLPSRDRRSSLQPSRQKRYLMTAASDILPLNAFVRGCNCEKAANILLRALSLRSSA